MTKFEEAENRIRNINEDLDRNYGVSSFILAFQALHIPDTDDIANYTGEKNLIYRSEIEVSKINANIIVEFKFTPLSESSKDIVNILTLKVIPPRNYRTMQLNLARYDLTEEVDIANDINKLSNVYDKITKNKNIRDSIPKDDRLDIENGLKLLKTYENELSKTNAEFEIKLNSAASSTFKLNMAEVSKYLSNEYVLKKIIYLCLEHRIESTKIKKVTSHLEESLENFSWSEFYKSNINIRKNIAINYLDTIASEEVFQIVNNKDYARSRGGYNPLHNRTTLSLALFTLLTDINELNKNDIGKVNKIFKSWKIDNHLFDNIRSQLIHEDIDNKLYFSILENIYRNIFSIENSKKNNEDLKFRFEKGNLAFLFSSLKNRGLLDTFNKNYSITDLGIERLKQLV